MLSEIFYARHKSTLDAALEACQTRAYWSPFQESPSARFHEDGADALGKATFESYLNTSFDLPLPGEIGRTGQEVSPYTCQPLGIDYPRVDPDQTMQAALAALPQWISAGHKERAGVCMEMALQLEKHCFTNAYATMHTAGQTYLMAYSGSGPNALDRGVEALAYAFKAQEAIREQAVWSKPFGKAGMVTLDKTYRLVPRGIAVVICCATFPMWNAYPALFANLATGNPVVLKPHPNGILPVAIAVKICRQILANNGYDPNLILMAADTRAQPITVELLRHKETKIIDYTGSQQFGTWIEENFPGKLVFTETAGCNGVVVQSTDNITGLINGLANSLCAFSAQMCTSPQNIHIPADGLDTDQGPLSFEGFRDQLVEAIRNRTSNGAKAAALCGAIQAQQSIELLEELHAQASALPEEQAQIVLQSMPYAHPEFESARTATPMVLEVSPEAAALYQKEHFAPVCFLIREQNAQTALTNACSNAKTFGAISSYLYSVDNSFKQAAMDAFAQAGASLWCNMTVPMPINFAAAYSDYHVSGLNPAGNACLTDMAFVASRFRIIQLREPAHE